MTCSSPPAGSSSTSSRRDGRRPTVTSMRSRGWASTSWRSPQGSSASPQTTSSGWSSASSGPAEGQAGGRDPIRRRRRDHPAGARAGGHPGRRLRDRPRPALPGRRRIHGHDRGRGDYGGGTSWRTDVVATFARELGLAQVMFEAADPEVVRLVRQELAPRSTCSSTTPRSSSWSACAAGSGAPRACGAASSPTGGLGSRGARRADQAHL